MERVSLEAGKDFTRPPQDLWSLYLKKFQNGDRIIIGAKEPQGPTLPSVAPLAMGTVVSPGGPFETHSLPYDVRPDTDWDHLDSWAGLARGPRWAYGIEFTLADREQNSAVTKPMAFAQPLPASDYVALLYSSGSGERPTVLTTEGRKLTVDSQTEALAWRAWPPIYRAKLLVGWIETKGQTVRGLNPAGRTVFAVSSLPTKRATASQSEIAAIREALATGSKEWLRMQRQEKMVAELRSESASMPSGSLAVLPPNPAGPAVGLASRAGLLKRSVILRPEQLIDPAQFNPRRFPVALYAGSEDYVHTVREAGDAADAIVRYVKDGGTLLLLSGQPWPMNYATGPGFHRSEPLTGRLGLPLYIAVETAPEDKLSVQKVAGQKVLNDVPDQFPYPSGDPRLRSINRARIPAAVHYSPIYHVIGASGKNYGDAAGLIEFPGGGRVLYLWCGLMRDTDQGSAITQAALRYLIHQASGSK